MAAANDTLALSEENVEAVLDEVRRTFCCNLFSPAAGCSPSINTVGIHLYSAML